MKRTLYFTLGALGASALLAIGTAWTNPRYYHKAKLWLASITIPYDQCFDGAVRYCIASQDSAGKVQYPKPTDYWKGSAAIDDQGLPFRQGKFGRYYNASSIALTIYGPRLFDIRKACNEFAEAPTTRAALQWALEHQVPISSGAVTWHYDYDTQINDVLLKAPFASAFSQAAFVERLLLMHCVRQDPTFLDLAKRAARAFSVPVTEGGLRSEDPAFVWFQEVPLPDRHNPYILNAHLYAIYVLNLAHTYFPEEGFDRLARRGLDALIKALPAVDSGHWTRYDLRPAYPAYDLSIAGTNAILKSVSVQIGDQRSEVSFLLGDFKPLGNRFSGRNLKQVWGGGISLPNGMILNFILPTGREFHWSLLDTSMSVTARIACCDHPLDISTIARTPSLPELVRLPLKSRLREGQEEVLTFETGLYDANWGISGPEYQPYHAVLMAHLYRQTGRKELFLYALRWQGFIRSFERRSQSRQGSALTHVFDRIPFQPHDQLVDVLTKRFGNKLPSEVDERELRTTLDEVYPLAPGESCEGSNNIPACDLRRKAWSTLGYDSNT